MKNVGIAFIVLGLVVAILKLLGVGGPDARIAMMLSALVLAFGGWILYRRARRGAVEHRA